MNHFDLLSFNFRLAETRRDGAAPGSQDWATASGDLDELTAELRLISASLAGREAAIMAGHRALARAVTTK